MNIEKLLKSLELEIKSEKSTPMTEEQMARLKEIALKYRGEDQIISFDEVAENVKKDPDEFKIFTGWEKLDGIIGGFRSQQLVVVSALTKSGKTSFLMDMTSRMKDHNVLWLPYEESAEELVRKFVERGEAPPHGFTPSRMR